MDCSPRPHRRLLCGKLFDSRRSKIIERQVITVDEHSGLILAVAQYEDDSAADRLLEQLDNVIDLRHLTVIPGLIDAHVHLFLHPYSETPWQTQVLEESLVERTVRAVAHARATVEAGYTTVRDLGTEGAQDADLHLKRALSPPLSLSPAPRMYVASKAIVSTGAYGPKTQTWDDVQGIQLGQFAGAEVADGVEEIRKVVRRQIGRGADWIKLYADYGTRSMSSQTSPAAASQGYPVFSLEEMRAAVIAAHRQGVKVAAHATRADVILDCVKAGISTIEHGYDADEGALCAMKEAGIIWVPTLAAYSEGAVTARNKLVMLQQRAALAGDAVPSADFRQAVQSLHAAEDRWTRMQRAFKMGLAIGVTIACGGDTGVFAHGRNSLEIERMISLGADPLKVLSWSTLHGWFAVRPALLDNNGHDSEATRTAWRSYAEQRRSDEFSESNESQWLASPGGYNEQLLGSIEPMFAADIVGLQGDLEAGPEAFMKTIRSVAFVMQAGRIVKA